MIKGEKMRVKINLDTMSSIKKFVEVVSRIDDKVTLCDDTGHCIDAKSLLGVICSLEWGTVYCECDRGISGAILPWIVQN